MRSCVSLYNMIVTNFENSFMKLYIMFFLLIFGFLRANSQSLSIFDVDTTNFPIMKAKFFAFDKDGKQLRPNISDFSLTENGQPRTITNVTCPDPKPPVPLSSVLVFDVSGSMTGAPLDMEKDVANSWVNMLNLGFSDCAVTSFSDDNYINQDFTTNKNKLINGINSLGIIGGTDYNAAMINPAAGGILMAKTGKHKRIIIFLTDGQPNFEPRTQEIINEAKKNGVTIYCISINRYVNHTMIELSNKTGGLYFENIKSKEEVEETMRIILAFAQNSNICEIEWQSGINCQTTLSKIELKLNPLNLTANTRYQSLSISVASLEFSPSFISFKNITPGNQKDTLIKVTARNFDFNITNITSSNPAFTINKTNFNLTKDQSVDLKISFSPKDSDYTYSNFKFETNICPENYNVSGGFYSKIPKVQTLKLTKPNGGEEFVIGSDSLITWEGISASDSVQLEYCIKKGSVWKSITNSTSGLKHLWKNIPKPASNECKLRVKQMCDSTNSSKSGSLQFTLNNHTNRVNNATWSPDGKFIGTASDDQTAIIWDATNGKEIQKLIGHAGIIEDVCWNPDGMRVATSAFWNTIVIIWDVLTGKKIHTLSEHSDYITSVCWSPDGNHIASSSYDNTAIIWDASTGTKLNTLIGHTNHVMKVSWSPDGTYIATASEDNTAIIWDATSGTKLHTLNGEGNKLIDVQWSPDGKRIATSSYNNVPRIWDALSGVEVQHLVGHSEAVYKISWSSDGKRIATASFDGKAIIWNAITGSIIHILKASKYWVYDIKWSPNDKYVITSGTDNFAVIWNANSGSQVFTLNDHTTTIYHVNWSPDGSHVVTASWDKTAKIWFVEDKILQQDESDSVFSIVAPHASANNIDMKECLLGKVKDSVITDIIENISTYPIRIDSIYFTGADASNFRLLSHILPITIKPNDKISLEFGFGPGRVGLHSADMIILTQSDTLFKKIIGTGYQPQLSINSKILDFGEVFIGSERTFTDTVVVKNISAQLIDIPKSYQDGPDKAQFEIISGDGSFKLNPNEERKLTVRFKPNNAGRTTGGIAFEYNGVGSPAMVTLFGEGKNKLPNLQSNMTEIPNLICTNVFEGKLSITNKCTEIIYLSDMNLKGINSTDFSIPPFSPFILEPDSTIQINIQFSPLLAGTKTASLEITSTAEPDSIINIVLTARKDSINISSLENTFDLGDIYLNQTKDSSITLKNFGTLRTGASLISSSNIALTKNEIVLSENETTKIPFKFKGQSIEGNINEKITIIDSVCNAVKEVIITGTAIKANAYATLQVGSLEAYPGDTIEIPINIIYKSKLEIAGITSLITELSYNPTLLLPLGYTSENINSSTSKIKLMDLPISKNEIAKIKFIVGLGNAETSILNLENVETNGGIAKIETQPGTFKLLGICPAGGNRLINPSGKINISSIKPNPSDNEIEVELQLVEKTGYKLIIVNSNGQTVREINKENSNKGIVSENIEVLDLVSGVYNLILQTESEMMSKHFLILK